jgi:hypothetical protein
VTHTYENWIIIQRPTISVLTWDKHFACPRCGHSDFNVTIINQSGHRGVTILTNQLQVKFYLWLQKWSSACVKVALTSAANLKMAELVNKTLDTVSALPLQSIDEGKTLLNKLTWNESVLTHVLLNRCHYLIMARYLHDHGWFVDNH